MGSLISDISFSPTCATAVGCGLVPGGVFVAHRERESERKQGRAETGLLDPMCGMAVDNH
jgi:hypothetical protein